MMSRKLELVVLLGLAGGCNPAAAEVQVTVEWTPALARQLRCVTVTALRDDGTGPRARSYDTGSQRTRSVSVALVSGAHGGESVTVYVQGGTVCPPPVRNPRAGLLVETSRRLVLPSRGGNTPSFTFSLDDECVGVLDCPPGTTCSHGLCRSQESSVCDLASNAHTTACAPDAGPAVTRDAAAPDAPADAAADASSACLCTQCGVLDSCGQSLCGCDPGCTCNASRACDCPSMSSPQERPEPPDHNNDPVDSTPMVDPNDNSDGHLNPGGACTEC